MRDAAVSGPLPLAGQTEAAAPVALVSTAMPNAPVARFGDYLELTKPRLSALSVVTALVGYLVVREGFAWGTLLHVGLGTALCAAGVATLNQWMEWETDARMARTRDRPIPTGKVATGSAFVLGWGLVCAGLADLYLAVNGWAALLALATVVAYLGFYTPAKRLTRWSTEIGAVSGALPPLIGWAGAHGGVGTLGWVLFAVLFFWQIPHFMAVAWLYRHDYAAVRFPMLPVLDAEGGRVARWAFAHTVLLVVVSILPAALGQTGWLYPMAALLLGGFFLRRAAAFLRREGRDGAARRLFLASVLYLPLVLGALVVDRWWVFAP
jgi:protoheme IX farnesyltransferase